MNPPRTPFISRLIDRKCLSASKQTFHLSVSTQNAPFAFRPGDSVAIYPANDPKEVDLILAKGNLNPDEPVFDKRKEEIVPLKEFLLHRANLFRLSSQFIKKAIEKKAPLEFLLEPERKEELSVFLNQTSLQDLFQYAPLSGAEIASLTLPLLPRFYSIASASSLFPNEMHLLVAHVEYLIGASIRKGVGSHFLCHLAELYTTPIPLYIQPSNHFSLPEDPDASIILIGPGTGVAPFRAFIQERLFRKDPGRNWLFFGERNRASDFYYEEFWISLQGQGRIRLDLAFSRDQKEKEYVQNKMYEQRKSLWQWIEEGAYIYVCGDADKMAKDVEQMLLQIGQEEGGYSEKEAFAFFKKMSKEKKYLKDVYS